VGKSTGKRRSGARWILSAGCTLPTPCAALKVQAGVLRLGAAHQPLPAPEVARFYLATHPRRARFSPDGLHWRSARSPCSRGVGRVHVASRRHDDREAGILTCNRFKVTRTAQLSEIINAVRHCRTDGFKNVRHCLPTRFRRSLMEA
jgi:hypothetical protein